MFTDFARKLIRADGALFAVLQSVAIQGSVLVINFATGILTARLLGPVGRGVFAAVTLWPQVLAGLALCGVSNALLYNLRQEDGNRRGAVVSAAMIIGMLSAAGAVAVGLVLAPFLMAEYDPSAIILAQICVFATFTHTVHSLIKQTFAGVGAFASYNFAAFIPFLLYFIGLLVAIAFTSLTPEKAALILLLSGVLGLVSILPLLVRAARPSLEGVGDAIAKLSAYGGRAAPNDIIANFAAYGDRLVLIPLISPTELGFYTVALSLSGVITTMQLAVNSILFSSMSKQQPREITKRLHDYAFRFILHGLAVAVIVLFLLDHWVLVLLYGPEFAAAALLFRILLVVAALGCLAHVTTQLYFALDRPGIPSIVNSISFAISLGSVMVLVPHYGATGAAWGLLIGAVVRLTLLLGGIWFQLGLPLPRPYLTRSDFAYVRDRLT